MSPSFAWFMLVIAGLLDVGWAVSMKYAEGYTRPGWSIASLVLLAAFVFLLGRALEACSRSALPIRSGPASVRPGPSSWASCCSGRR